MNRHAQFVAVVQAGALLRETISFLRPPEAAPREGARDIVDVVARACMVAEEAIPANIAEAAREFLLYAFGDEPIEPEWYQAWRESVPHLTW